MCQFGNLRSCSMRVNPSTGWVRVETATYLPRGGGGDPTPLPTYICTCTCTYLLDPANSGYRSYTYVLLQTAFIIKHFFIPLQLYLKLSLSTSLDNYDMHACFNLCIMHHVKFVYGTIYMNCNFKICWQILFHQQ